MNFKNRHFINLWDYTPEEIAFILKHAHKLKKETKEGKIHHTKKGKNLVCIFSKPSLRTRVSFEIGAMQLGMGSLTLKKDEIDLGVRESVADVARVLSGYADCVMIRTFAHKDVQEFAKYSKIPVINGLTDDAHPCQIMADLLTAEEQFGSLKGLNAVFLGNAFNVTNSLLVGCALVGMNVAVATPEGCGPDSRYVEKAIEIGKETGAKVELTTDAVAAVTGAHILYTDVWTSMGQEDNPAEKQKFMPYQINSGLLKHADKKAIVLHCLPAHRGEEITHEALEQFADVIFEEAENRMHAQKAIMDLLLP